MTDPHRLLFTRFNRKKNKKMNMSNFVVFHYAVCLAAALSHLLIEWLNDICTQIRHPQFIIRNPCVFSIWKWLESSFTIWRHMCHKVHYKIIIIIFPFLCVCLFGWRFVFKWNWNFEWSMSMAYISWRHTFQKKKYHRKLWQTRWNEKKKDVWRDWLFIYLLFAEPLKIKKNKLRMDLF